MADLGFRLSKAKRCYVYAHQGPFEELTGPHLLSVIYAKRCMACNAQMELYSALPMLLTAARDIRDYSDVFESER